MAECGQCGREFTPSRKDSKFCSAKCRVNASRNSKPVTDNLIKAVTSDDAKSVTAIAGLRLPWGDRPDELPLHAGHVIHPHHHVMMTEGPFMGQRKPCSQRYWCESRREWLSGKACA